LRIKYKCRDIATGYRNRYNGEGLRKPINIMDGRRSKKIPMPIFQPLLAPGD